MPDPAPRRNRADPGATRPLCWARRTPRAAMTSDVLCDDGRRPPRRRATTFATTGDVLPDDERRPPRRRATSFATTGDVLCDDGRPPLRRGGYTLAVACRALPRRMPSTGTVARRSAAVPLPCTGCVPTVPA